jgi:DNA-binding transcriptional LysR family regulator
MDRIEWSDVAHFLAVCRAGSLSAAARRLGVEHTTVGRRVAALEKALGARLFDRSRDGYVPTARGAEIRALAEDMENAADALARRAAGGDASLGGTLRVTTTETLASHFLIPALPRLAAAHPGLRVEIVADNSTLSLARREADVALRLSRPAGGALVGRSIGRVGYGVYASREFVRRHKAQPGAFEPDLYPVVGFDETLADLPLARWLAAACAPVGAVPAVTANTLAGIFASILAGLGAGVVPCHRAEDEKRLVRLLAPSRVLSAELWVVYHRDVRELARLRAFVDFVADEAKRARARLAGPAR